MVCCTKISQQVENILVLLQNIYMWKAGGKTVVFTPTVKAMIRFIAIAMILACACPHTVVVDINTMKSFVFIDRFMFKQVPWVEIQSARVEKQINGSFLHNKDQFKKLGVEYGLAEWEITFDMTIIPVCFFYMTIMPCTFIVFFPVFTHTLSLKAPLLLFFEDYEVWQV